MGITRRAAPSREKIKIPFDSPVVVRLEQTNGTEAASDYNGLEYCYNVMGNNGPAKIYLSPECRDSLVALGAKVGDVVEVLKYRNAGEVCWSVSLLEDGDTSDAREPEPPQPTPQPEPQRGIRILAAEPRRGYTNGHANGHAKPAGHFAALPPVVPERRPQPQSGPVPVAQPVRGNSHLEQCLCTAIDAAKAASEYARRQDFSVTFLGSDIRAMANTLMIDDQRRGDQ